MIRLASLASWAARKTCIKGGLRRDCGFEYAMNDLYEGGEPWRLVPNKAKHFPSSFQTLTSGRGIPSTRHLERGAVSSAGLVRLRIPPEGDFYGCIDFVLLRFTFISY